MNLGWLLWLIGVIIAVIVGLSVFGIYNVPVVIDQLTTMTNGVYKALYASIILLAIAKLV
jgi:hypothetical protein